MHDFALRLASVLLGSVPVTVNWGADSLDRILYKRRKTGAELVVVDSNSAEAFNVKEIGAQSGVPVVNLDELDIAKR